MPFSKMKRRDPSSVVREGEIRRPSRKRDPSSVVRPGEIPFRKKKKIKTKRTLRKAGILTKTLRKKKRRIAI